MSIAWLTWRSDYNGSSTKMSKILLNGNNICMVTDIYVWTSWRVLTLCSSFRVVCLVHEHVADGPEGQVAMEASNDVLCTAWARAYG